MPSRLSQDVKDIKRLEEILRILFSSGFGYLIDRLKLIHFLPLRHRVQRAKFRQREPNPARVRKLFEELGGTFIKLGQLLSLRPDLIPQEYSTEFAKLQDSVPAFSGEAAQELFFEQVKGKRKKISSFTKKPIAAASIGQVHEVLLASGERLAVKIQRPHIQETIQTDIDILHKLAELLESHYERIIIDPVAIVQEFERYTKKELDYIIEAKNIAAMHAHAQASHLIKVPQVYPELSTSSVLAMEFVSGTPLSRAQLSRQDREQIARRLSHAIFHQVFVDGIFHADPHPGNIFLLPHRRIAMLDFGIVGRLPTELREQLSQLFISLIAGNIDGITESILALGVVQGEPNMAQLKEDIHDALSPYYGAHLEQVNPLEVFTKLITLAKQHHLLLPTNFLLLAKCVVTVESVCASLDPHYDIVATARPFLRGMVHEKHSPKQAFRQLVYHTSRFKNFLLRLPDQSTEFAYRMRHADQKISNLDTDVRNLTVEMDKSTNRIVLGVTMAALIVASALMVNTYRTFSIIGFSIAFLLFFYFLLLTTHEKQEVKYL
ncbi:AarF/ABC1/UbiB kinase family protein [Candidatus Woesearchaeota archaeon]|nr:AarF/ABC1/UbiB kinase family protein [Candidatus Woesearchaeota archaeon]